MTSIATKVPKKPKPAAEPEPPPVGPVYQMVPIDSVHIDPANVRRHPDRNLAAIRASLARFGQQRPIVVDGNGIVRAGNGTLDAARALGWSEIAVVRTELQGTEATAYAIADNRSSELAEWDGVGLADTLRALQSEEFPLDAVGYTADEIDALVKGMGTGMTGEPAADPGAQIDRAAELQAKWGTASGQLWVIPSKATPGGEHRLLCGDSTRAADVGRVMGGEKAKLIVTSPPYNQDIQQFASHHGMYTESTWVKKVGNLAYPDSLPEPEYQEQQRKCLDTWFEFLDMGASVFYNHKNRYRDKVCISPLRWLPGPFTLRQEIVWSRPGGIAMNARMFIPSDERIYWLYKGDDFYFDDTIEIKSLFTVWEIPFEANTDHAVGFPREIPRRCIVACSRSQAVVIDPFIGSGTTMVAAEETGRLCRGLEIEPKYVAVALERLAGMGLEPRLAS